MLSYLQEHPGDVDLFLPTSYGVTAGRERGLIAEVDYDEVPNFRENLLPEWRNRPYIQADAFFRDALTQGLAVNTDVLQTPVSSWSDIKRDALEGELTLRDDVTSRFTNAAQAIGVDVNAIPGDGDLFDSVVSELHEQDRNAFVYWRSGAESMELVGQGDATMAEAWGGRTRALQREGNEHVAYVIPDEGTATITEDFAIPADSEKKATVYELLDFTYQREHLIDFSDLLGYPIPVVDTPDAIRALPDFVEHPDQLAWVDWERVLPDLERWAETFDRIKDE